MKKAMIAIIIALFLGSPISVQAGYQTEVTVTPSTEPHQFVVNFKIIQTKKDDKQDVLSTPMMIVKESQKGRIEINNEKEEMAILCTALVKKTDTGIETTTTVTINENGEKKLSSSHIINIKN